MDPELWFTLRLGHDPSTCYCGCVSSPVEIAAHWREQPGELLPKALGELTRNAVTWALAAVVLDFMSIHAASKHLGTGWKTVNDAVLTAGYKHLIADEIRFERITTIGVDEHCWSRKGRKNPKLVTVVINLTLRQYELP